MSIIYPSFSRYVGKQESEPAESSTLTTTHTIVPTYRLHSYFNKYVLHAETTNSAISLVTQINFYEKVIQN